MGSASTESSPTPDIQKAFQRHGVKVENGDTLRWDRSSPRYPRNWRRATKCWSVFIISWLELYMTAISSSGTATADTGGEEYGISRTLSYFAFVSIYLIGQTIGGIFCSPISEVFGRRTIYIIGTFLFCVASVITAAVPSVIAVYFGRFFQGLASSIPATVAFGSFSDLYDAHTRIWIVYIYTLAGMFGLAAGPIFSTYVTLTIGWRWVYYISTIVSAASAGACFLIKESNADQLLDARVADVRKDTGNARYVSASSHSRPSLSSFATNSLFRPLQFLLTEPVVFFCAVLCAIAFGLIYGLTESLTIVYTAPPFSFSEMSASLAFVPILLGELLNILPRIYDHHVFARYKVSGRRILPESKIRSFAFACPALALGLWIFAWTIPPRVTSVPWPVSMIGLVLIGFALNDFSYVLFGYATDSYGPYAASAVSAISLTRTLTAAAFPLFTTQMYEGLGSNVATTILAAVATAFTITPVLFLRYGAKLRAKSSRASNDEDALTEENAHMRGQSDESEANEANEAEEKKSEA